MTATQASAAKAERTKEAPPINRQQQMALPHCAQGDLVRLSENGQGFIVYAHTSYRDWDTIIAPTYFRLCAQMLARHDRIEIVAKEMSTRPVYGTLVVTAVDRGTNEIAVAALAGPVEMESGEASPLDVLGLRRGCTREDVNTAFKAKSRHLHPDHGGTDEDFRRLVEAKDAALRLFDLQ